MAITDLMIFENGSGGDCAKTQTGNDLQTTIAFSNDPYLGLFGAKSHDPNDWWGNKYLDPAKKQVFTSATPQALIDNSLNSGGRQKIEEAANEDLEFLKAFAVISATVIIEAPSRIKIKIKAEPDPDSELLKGVSIQDILREPNITINI